ncbi:FIG022708: hypothetical protein [hydrothermal vent metagenome]|uniref:Calcineurin-like phosphoesterase domain-containing protein n=1 Tax=hydrothermal vent metagenome TaxID=652676 RepID=A0A1W1EJV2_9ZZZZ
MIEIEEGAIFISDVHYPHYGMDILDILDDNIDAPQIFLMGDIFDMLFDTPYLREYNRELIDKINELSLFCEIYYFEGNHDFNLSSIFPTIKIFSISLQPQIMLLNQKYISLAHGDKYNMGILYNIYTKLIRNSFINNLIPNRVIKKKLKYLKNKSICHKIDNFEDKIIKILDFYNSNLVIEAHYHQGVIIDNYISLPSLVCQKSIGVIKNKTIKFFQY